MASYSNNGIPIGAMVAVHFDDVRTTHPCYMTQRYNGTIQRVSKVVNYGAWGSYFELKGVESEKGVPYTFTIDELRRVDV